MSKHHVRKGKAGKERRQYIAQHGCDHKQGCNWFDKETKTWKPREVHLH